MAILQKDTGTRVAGSAANLYEGRGRIMAYLISHAESTAQLVTFYDNTAASGTIIHQVHVHPNRSPVYVQFARRPDESKLLGIAYQTGLTIDPGNCEVNVWAIGY